VTQGQRSFNSSCLNASLIFFLLSLFFTHMPDTGEDVDVPRRTRAQAYASLAQTRSRTGGSATALTTKIGPPIGVKKTPTVKKNQKVSGAGLQQVTIILMKLL
jgi:hypothetical protein